MLYQQPQYGPLALDPQFPSSNPQVFVPSMGLGAAGFSLVQVNSVYSGPRFESKQAGLGLRLYSNNGGVDDDVLRSDKYIATAQYAPLTTVLQFIPKKQSSTGSAIVWLANYTYGTVERFGHVLTIHESTNVITLGYEGGNGYNATCAFTPSVSPWDRVVTVVISTNPVTGKISIACDGQIFSITTGLESYVGGGLLAATARPGVGNGTYTNYYGPNGHLLLFATIPSLYVDQVTARDLSSNPWQIFFDEEDEADLLFSASAGGGSSSTGASNVTLSGLSGTAAGTASLAGASSAALAGLTGTETGTAVVVGASSTVLGSLSMTAAGTVTSASAVTGSSSVTLDNASDTAAAAVTTVGASSTTLATVTRAATGAVLAAGPAATTLASIAPSAAGTVGDAGVASTTMQGIAAVGAGAVKEAGTCVTTLATVTNAAAGAVPVAGASSATLGGITLAATGTAAQPGVTTGSSTVTLESATNAATAASTTNGSSVRPLDSVVLAASGGVLTAAGLDCVLAPLSSNGAGTVTSQVAIAGQSSITLANLTLIATGWTISPPTLKAVAYHSRGEQRMYRDPSENRTYLDRGEIRKFREH